MYEHTLVEDLIPVDNDTLIHPNLRGVLPNIQKRLRCDFMRKDGSHEITSYGYLHRVYVVFPGQPLASGWMSVNDDQYKIGSHTISNQKFGDFNSEYYTRTTTKRDTLLKHVNTYIRRLANVELIKQMWKARIKNGDPVEARHAPMVEVAHKFRKARSEPLSEERRASWKLGINNDAMLREVQLLSRSGHTFSSPDIAEAVTNYVAAVDARVAWENQGFGNDVVFVNFHGIEGRDPDVCRGFMDKYEALQVFNSADVNLYSGLREDELSRLGALSICQPGQFVANVGMRVNSTCFFIYAGDHV